MGFLQAIREGKFAVNVEFTPHNRGEVIHVANIGKGLAELNKKYKEHGIVFGSVSLTQNPGGNLSYDHQASIRILREQGFPEEVEISPHITGKDMNVDAVKSLLISLVESGVHHVLALTGDLSATSKGVFEVDALGLLQLIRELNLELLRKAKTAEDFASIPALEAGAAVSPYKYTDGSLAMQYIRAQKKIREGAAFLTLQSGWDSERCEHLIKELGHLGTPIIGNALVVTYPVAKYMQTLPGCVVTEDFLNVLKGKKLIPCLERAGQQFAMFRQLGYAGVDLGKPGEFKKLEHVEKVIDTALQIKDWREFKDNITFPAPESAPPPVRKSAAFSKTVHNLALSETGPLYGVAKAVLTPFNKSAEREGALYRLFNSIEGFGKGVMYQCERCGDCFLPENHYVCTMGQCEKGLPNPPCGDADPSGRCGNNEDRVCVGETLYYRLLHYKDFERFKEITLPRRNPELANTASLLNYYFGRDHAKKANPLEGSGLIQIGELLHASIPLPGAAMKCIQQMGDEGFTRSNRGLWVVVDLIKSQARQGARYLDVNVDALGADTPQAMRQYVRLIHKHGDWTPPCVDSSNVEVLLAGLEEWFSFGDVRPPLVNSIAYVDKDKYGPVLDMRKRRDFSAVCLLVGPAGPLQSADEMHAAAKEMFRLLSGAGFRPDQIFSDTATLGLASDGCMGATGEIKPSHTHNSFHAIRRIRQDPEMRGAHALLGVSNWVHGAQQRRVGHIRAFIAVARKFGLDAVIADVGNQFGVTPAAPELVGVVETFVALDGGEDSMVSYSAKMKEAREANWI